MATATLEERYAANLHGVLSCFDRMIIVELLAKLFLEKPPKI